MSAYPEHDKLAAVKAKAEIVGDFLEWLNAESDLSLGTWVESKHGDARLVSAGRSIGKILADYLGIDEAALEREKRAMLAAIREGATTAAASVSAPEGGEENTQ